MTDNTMMLAILIACPLACAISWGVIARKRKRGILGLVASCLIGAVIWVGVVFAIQRGTPTNIERQILRQLSDSVYIAGEFLAALIFSILVGVIFIPRSPTAKAAPASPITKGQVLVYGYWVTTLAWTVVAVAMVALYTPDELTMGPIQKIFYLHLPVAICTFLACLVCFISSLGYLLTRKTLWDDLAWASARVSVQLCSVVLLTGMIWGRSAWGVWWVWSPRLTFSLVLWLLYVVYLMIRMSVESGQRRAVISGVYAIIAFLDVPLVYLSVRMMPDIHPTSIDLAPEMKLTLAVWFVPVMLLSAGLIVARFHLNRSLRNGSSLQPRGFEPVMPAKFEWTEGAS